MRLCFFFFFLILFQIQAHNRSNRNKGLWNAVGFRCPFWLWFTRTRAQVSRCSQAIRIDVEHWFAACNLWGHGY